MTSKTRAFHDGAWFPLKNPAPVTIPLAFVVGIVVSLLDSEKAAFEAYDQKLTPHGPGS